MKIIIVGPAHPLRGGIADTNESFCRTLNQLGYSASLVSFSLQYPNFLFPGKTQYSAESTPNDLDIQTLINSVNPVSWYQTAKYINAQKPDLVVFRYWLPFMGASLGSIARLLDNKIKLVALCDNVIPHEGRIGDRQLTQYFVKPFDGFITMSKSVEVELDQFTNRPKMYFPHPINDNLGVKQDKLSARQQLGLNPNGKYLLFFGLVRKYKGLDLMLEALGLDTLKKENITLIIAGEFYDDPQIYQNIIDKHGLKDQVIIRNEFIPASDIQYYFSAVDMVTQTYHSASQSGVTQIAYHFDCPILVTDVGGLSEFIPHQKVGYVTPKNPEAIANAILDFYMNNRVETFVENIKIEKQKYSWKTFCEHLIELYNRL